MIAEDLVLTSAHVVGRPDAEVTLFFPGRPETYRGTAVWVGEPARTDAALVRLTSPNWVPVTGWPPLWGRTVTHTGDLRCEAWGLPAIAQRDGRPAETAHPVGRLQPGDGFVADRYVMRLDGTPPEHDTGSPWSGLSGAAMFCGDLLAGVVMSDPRGWRHSRLEVVPAYLLLRDAHR